VKDIYAPINIWLLIDNYISISVIEREIIKLIILIYKWLKYG
jgi:hypothetical protein